MWIIYIYLFELILTITLITEEEIVSNINKESNICNIFNVLIISNNTFEN